MNDRNKRDPRFDDGTRVASDFRDSGRRIQPRKIEQLCAQIRRALELSLLGVLHDPVFETVDVAAVEPCTDPGRLRVVFSVHGVADEDLLAVIQARIEAARGVLTAEIAAAIHRRKVPELSFEVRAGAE